MQAIWSEVSLQVAHTLLAIIGVSYYRDREHLIAVCKVANSQPSFWTLYEIARGKKVASGAKKYPASWLMRGVGDKHKKQETKKENVAILIARNSHCVKWCFCLKKRKKYNKISSQKRLYQQGGFMRKAKKYSKQQLMQAIEGSGGIVSEVARRLNCDWNTAKKYIDLREDTRQAFQAESEIMLDQVERCAYDVALSGDGPMVRYILSTKGKGRGWSEDIIADVKAKGDPVIQLVFPDFSV